MGISNIQLNNAGLAAGARHGQTHYPTLHFVLSAAHWSVVLTLAIRSQQSKQPISCPFDMSHHLFVQHNQHPSDALNHRRRRSKLGRTHGAIPLLHPENLLQTRQSAFHPAEPEKERIHRHRARARCSQRPRRRLGISNGLPSYVREVFTGMH